MCITTKLPDWYLNYQVAAFGAYATILVESIYLILRGFENASLLSISILTNSSAVLVVGFSGASPTPLAILRICLTSLFLLNATILHKNETFDGTYAALCSVAHLTYQLLSRHSKSDSERYLPQHEKRAKTDEARSESCLHAPPTDYNHAANFSRGLRILFGDSFCLECAMVLVAMLGTVMTYRVFDFDLGFGLVFAFMSAFLSSVILLFINYARMQGRQMNTQKDIRRLANLILAFGTFCFVFFTIAEFPDIELSWWRVTFGVAWFGFLFRTAYVACRFLVHATFLACEACSQREAGIYGPLTQKASAGCIWNDYVALPVLNHYRDDTLDGSATFRITRQEGLDLVERFWLNNQEWFQISPRSFVIFFVSCIALAVFTEGVLNPNSSYASIGSRVSKDTAFYVTIAFTFVSTGHTPVGDSPELMFVSLRHSFPGWRAPAKAVIITMLLHIYIVHVASADALLIFVTTVASTLMAPLLLAGISKRLDPTDKQLESGSSVERNDVSSDKSASSATSWTIDSAMVLSSLEIKCLDLRVLLLGLSITLFDVSCNWYEDEISIPRWPGSAPISVFVTAVWLYLENFLPRSRDVEPGILGLAATALVGIFSRFGFLDAFRFYDNEWEDEDFTRVMPIPENASHSKPILIALWYTTLFSMVVVNRRRVLQNAEQTVSATKGQPPQKDPPLFSFHARTLRTNFAWQLRHSSITIFLVFTMVASFFEESWPLEMNTTVASLLFFALIVSFQLQPTCDNMSEKRSLPHVAALGFCSLVTTLAVGLNRHGVLSGLFSDPKSDWKAGTWSAMFSYQLFVAVILRFEGRGGSRDRIT